MKIAVVADIHGNLLALEAVIKDIERQAPDVTVNLGDCVSGPLWPEETAQRLRALNWPTVRGNHDRWVVANNIPPSSRTDYFAASKLSDDSKEWLSNLPATVSLPEGLLLCHGTPDSDTSYLTEDVHDGQLRPAAEEVLEQRLRGTTAPVICCGHTHLPCLRYLAATGQTIFNPGSVGLPGYTDDGPPHGPHIAEVGSPHARYGMMTKTDDGWDFEIRIITYDWERAAAHAARHDRPDWAKPLATGYVIPLSKG